MLTVHQLLLQQMEICSKSVGQPLEMLYQAAHRDGMLRLANNIVSDPYHVLNSKYRLLPSTGDAGLHSSIRLD